MNFAAWVPIILTFVVILDHVLAAIPEERFAPGSTWQFIVHIARAITSAIARRPAAPPVAILLVFLLSSTALADSLNQSTTAHGPIITLAPAEAVQAPTLPPGAVFVAVPTCPPSNVPPAFWDSTAGKALTWVMAAGAGAVSIAGSVASIAATWPR